MTATIILPLALIAFWFYVPGLFENAAWKTVIVRSTGSLSMLLAAFVFTPVHDYIINAAVPLGLVAFVTTQIGLFQSKEFTSLALSTIAILCSVVTFLMWRTGVALEVMPMVQKAAFLSFFVWIGFTTRRFLVRPFGPHPDGC